jgi:DNA-binding LacI/PurR family transcriptional regulator
MQELGATAFDILYSKISSGTGESDVVLPVELVVRESCGCPGQATSSAASANSTRGAA